MVETTHDPDDEVLPPLADKWIQLRKSLSLVGDPIVLLGEGLPLRARRVLYDHSVTTVQQLLALDPQEIIANTNVGWASVAALLAKAAASMEATSGASETPDFVQLVDVVLDALPTLARDVVIGH